MAFSGRTKTTVSLVWKAAHDNVRVTGYRLFRNGVSVATKATPGYTYKGLKCGTPLHVRARRVRRGREHLSSLRGNGLDVDHGVHLWIASYAAPDHNAGRRWDDPARPVVADRLHRGAGEQQFERGRRQPRRQNLSGREGRLRRRQGAVLRSSTSTPRTSHWTTSISTVTQPR